MSVCRCDDCGRFCNRLYDVPCNPSYLGIDREVCEQCARDRVLSALGETWT